MSMASMSGSGRATAVAAAITLVTGLLSVANEWGTLMFIPIIASLGVLALFLMPAALSSLGSRGTLLVLFGVATALIWIVVAFDWIGWIGDHIADFDTIQFLVGLLAALYLAFAGWQAFRAEGGKFQLGPTKSPPSAPPSDPPPTQPSA
jgi:threonine/homoserine/homoserine lactone efflux protein